jgi:hypothetical protein
MAMRSQWIKNASPQVNAISQYPTIIAVSIALTVTMMVVTGCRIYVRTCMIKSMGIDDYVILFSAVSSRRGYKRALTVTDRVQVCSIVYNALCIGQSRYGLGLPIKLRPAANLNEYSSVWPFTPYEVISDYGRSILLAGHST